MNKIHFPEFKGVQILSVRSAVDEHFYNSGVDIYAVGHGRATATTRMSSYLLRAWDIIVANDSGMRKNVSLHFNLVDHAGIIESKLNLTFDALGPGEKMKRRLAPGNWKGRIILTQMVVDNASVPIDYSLGTSGRIRRHTSAIIVAVVAALVLVAYVVNQLNWKTYYYYPPVDIINETTLYVKPNGDKTIKLKAGAYLILLDKTTGPEQTLANGDKVKWYQVATGLSQPRRWVMSNSVRVTEKHIPYSERNLHFGSDIIYRGEMKQVP